MGTMVAVTADSEAEAKRRLERLQEIGPVPMASGRVFEAPGRGGRWMARAEPRQLTFHD